MRFASNTRSVRKWFLLCCSESGAVAEDEYNRKMLHFEVSDGCVLRGETALWLSGLRGRNIVRFATIPDELWRQFRGFMALRRRRAIRTVFKGRE